LSVMGLNKGAWIIHGDARLIGMSPR